MRKQSLNRLGRRLVGTTAVMALHLGAVQAQDADLASDDEFTVEEIIITASKRAKSLQDTPIAVSVTSAETIDQAKILDLSDLQSVVPSLRVSRGTSVASTTFTVRGFGNGGNANGTEPSVGVVVDGVFRSRSSSSVFDLPVVERIEVLSGPQSTIFGKNASAGVISIVTKEPSFETEGNLSVTYGKYDQRILKGYISGGLSDTVAASFSASINKRDGFTESLVGLSKVDDKNRWSLRGDLLFQPKDNIKVRLIGDYSEIDEICCTVGNLINGGTAGLIEALGGMILTTDDRFAYESVLNVDPENKLKDGGASLHAEIGFEGFDFTSISAYRSNVSGPSNGDLDFTSLDMGQARRSRREIDTYSQEFRLTSATDSRFSWMLGSYLYKESIEQTGATYYGADLRNYAFALSGGALATLEALTGNVGVFFAPGIEVQKRFAQDNKAFSLFGTVDYDLAEKLTATFGLNYTYDEKDVEIEVIDNPDVFSQLDLDTLFGGAFAPLKGLQFRPAQLGLPNAFEDGHSSDDKVTWQARLAWEVNDKINVYASVATGFKSTSWTINGFSQPLFADAAAIEAAGLAAPGQRYGSRFSDPEHAKVYEIGIKARFKYGYLNVALFDQSIKDFQTRAFDGVNFIDTNAGKLSSKGIEFDLMYQPTENWRFGFAGTLLDPVYDDFQNAPPPFGGAGVVDRSGTEPGGIHPFSGTASIVYSFEIGDGMNGYLRGEYYFESETGLSDAFPELTREVGTLNASAGLQFTEQISAQIWVRNLNNDQYITGGFNGVAQPGTVNSFVSAPRTFGATLSYNF